MLRLQKGPITTFSVLEMWAMANRNESRRVASKARLESSHMSHVTSIRSIRAIISLLQFEVSNYHQMSTVTRRLLGTKRASQDVGLGRHPCAWTRTFSAESHKAQQPISRDWRYMGVALRHVVEGQKRKLQSF